MRTGGQTYYLFPDHPSASSGQALGRTHITANSSGTELGKLLYRPWGETRFSTGTTPTTWRFTGQREDATIGLYFYNARDLDPQLGRFTQPDTIVPEPGNPQGWYSSLPSSVPLLLAVMWAPPMLVLSLSKDDRGTGSRSDRRCAHLHLRCASTQVQVSPRARLHLAAGLHITRQVAMLLLGDVAGIELYRCSPEIESFVHARL